jgi:inorganic pyrophosphatase
MRWSILLFSVALQSGGPAFELPGEAVAKLRNGLAAAARHQDSIWRDVAPQDGQGRVNALVEIARGDRRKFEFDIASNTMRLDRTIPEALGGYPINYGIVPQTISYDGDPFDVLVLGPPLKSGTRVRGAIVGVMRFEDETGPDAKVVITPMDGAGRPRYALTAADRDRMTKFFDAYKKHETGKFSRVTGWGGADEGQALVRITHAFFTDCRRATGTCVVTAR